ncbi:MAG TPA: SCO family protein [Vicinamibacterales bacterium]|nr:SCO family protein [Vicinamibacterales bacterium]
MKSRILLVWTAALTLATAAAAGAPESAPAPTQRVDSMAPPAGQMPRLLTEIGLDQRLNEQLPLDLPFRDEQGREVTLAQYFGKRPVVLTLVYYECPMLCTQVLNGLVSALGVLRFSIGEEFEVVTISFDPGETPELAAAKKAAYIERYGRPGAERGWHFLTGSPRSIRAVTEAVGFRYAYNESVDQFAHVSGFMVLTPDGRLSRYFYGIEYGPRDIRLALLEAADGRIGSAVDQLFLYCFHYDPKSGRYSLAIMRIVRLAGVLTVGLIVGGIVVMRRREKAKRRPGD